MPRALALLILVGALTGCAGSPEPAREASADIAPLEDIANAVAGEYVSVRQVGQAGDSVHLRIEPEAITDGLGLLMTQQHGDSQRMFELQLRPGESAEQFEARFIPRRAEREAAETACDMRFRLAGGRLVGATDPDECRFRADQQWIGLLKEIAFEGDQVMMADQLVLEDGTPLGEPDQLVLGRVASFRGTLARNESGSWRIARQLRLASGGNLIEPLDAAGMSLGILLNLELVESTESETPGLRLQVIEEASDRVIAETWAGPESRLIGVSLEDMRIEFRREP